MTAGTIHPLGENLFVIEGAAASCSAAVYRSGQRLYLLDTGSGPAQRGAVRAVVASYDPVEELVLLSSSACRGAQSNDDLIDELPAQRRLHLHPGPARPSRPGARRTSPQPYSDLEGPASVLIGSQRWPGWTLVDHGLDVLRIAPLDGERVAFHLAGDRALVVPDLSLTPPRNRRRRLQIQRASQLVRLLDATSVAVVVAGSGQPRDEAEVRRALLAMIAAHATVRPPIGLRAAGREPGASRLRSR